VLHHGRLIHDRDVDVMSISHTNTPVAVVPDSDVLFPDADAPSREPTATGDPNTPPAPRTRPANAIGGPADVLYVLVLTQVAVSLLAALGMVGLMGGNPLYLIVPALVATMQLVAATKVRRGRRWASWLLLVWEVLSLTRLTFNVVLAAVMADIAVTMNLANVVVTVVLPGAVIALCVRLLRSR
jgi:hypothetical protein